MRSASSTRQGGPQMAPRFTLKNDKRTGGCAVRSFPRKGQAVAGRLGPCSEARYRAHHHVAAALKYFDEVGTGTRGKRSNIRGRSRARLSASGTHIRGLLLSCLRGPRRSLPLMRSICTSAFGCANPRRAAVSLTNSPGFISIISSSSSRR
jgi:hypothetical protein